MKAKLSLAVVIGAIVMAVAGTMSNAQPLTKLTFALDWAGPFNAL